MADEEERLDNVYGDDNTRTKSFVDSQLNTFLDGHRFQINHTAEYNLGLFNKNVSNPMFADFSRYATYEDLVRSPPGDPNLYARLRCHLASQLEDAFDDLIKDCYRQGRNDPAHDPPPAAPPDDYEPTPRPTWTKEFTQAALSQWRYMPNRVRPGGGAGQRNKVVNADDRCISEHGSFIDPNDATQRLQFARAMAVWLNATDSERGAAQEKIDDNRSRSVWFLATETNNLVRLETKKGGVRPYGIVVKRGRFWSLMMNRAVTNHRVANRNPVFDDPKCSEFAAMYCSIPDGFVRKGNKMILIHGGNRLPKPVDFEWGCQGLAGLLQRFCDIDGSNQTAAKDLPCWTEIKSLVTSYGIPNPYWAIHTLVKTTMDVVPSSNNEEHISTFNKTNYESKYYADHYISYLRGYQTFMEKNGVTVTDDKLLTKFQDDFLPQHKDQGRDGYDSQLYLLADARRCSRDGLPTPHIPPAVASAWNTFSDLQLYLTTLGNQFRRGGGHTACYRSPMPMKYSVHSLNDSSSMQFGGKPGRALMAGAFSSEWVDGVKVPGHALVNLQQQRQQLIQDDQTDYGALSDILDALDDYGDFDSKEDLLADYSAHALHQRQRGGGRPPGRERGYFNNYDDRIQEIKKRINKFSRDKDNPDDSRRSPGNARVVPYYNPKSSRTPDLGSGKRAMYKPWQEGNRLLSKLQDAKARQDWNAVAEVDKELAQALASFQETPELAREDPDKPTHQDKQDQVICSLLDVLDVAKHAGMSNEATAAALAIMNDRINYTPAGRDEEDKEADLATGDSHVNFVDSSTAQCYLTQGLRTDILRPCYCREVKIDTGSTFDLGSCHQWQYIVDLKSPIRINMAKDHMLVNQVGLALRYINDPTDARTLVCYGLGMVQKLHDPTLEICSMRTVKNLGLGFQMPPGASSVDTLYNDYVKLPVDCSENGIPRFFDIGPPKNGQAYNLIDIFTNEPFDARKAFKRLQKVFPQILKDNETNAGKDFYIEPDKLKGAVHQLEESVMSNAFPKKQKRVTIVSPKTDKHPFRKGMGDRPVSPNRRRL